MNIAVNCYKLIITFKTERLKLFKKMIVYKANWNETLAVRDFVRE